MPIYAYRCDECGHELDALQKISDAPLIDCPACGAAALKKQITAAAFRLKGSGWYETDFKKDKRKNLHGDGEKSGEKPAEPDKKKEKPAAAEGKGAAEKPATKSDTTPSPKPKAKPAASDA